MQNQQLDLAFNYAQYTRRNIFLTGKAGTGKTTFLKQLRQSTFKRMIVVAPTGVAAINAGGVTIHSFFQLAPGMFLPNGGLKNGRETQHKYGYSKHKINILRSIDLLVIDEISMVRADLLDAIDDVLRRYQDRHLPFGGVQLLMIGDLHQLAPVTSDDEWQILKDYYHSPYFFDSLALKKTNYTTIELTHVYRQADPVFINILNKVRENKIDFETLRLLNARYQPGFNPQDNEGYITLTTHNYQAQEINKRKLEELPSREFCYLASIQGDFPNMSFPTDEMLSLKIGAQVMFCKNDSSPEKLYFNGKIGRVVNMSSDSVTVLCTSNESPNEKILINVTPQEWTNAKYVTNADTGEITEEIAGTFCQIPLKTAWAITIHKSQGLTFNHAIINAGSAFSHGQVYVALSRCRTLEGMVLSTPISPSVVMSDPNVLEYNHFIKENQPDEQQLARDKQIYIDEILCSIFDFGAIHTRMRYIVRLADEHLSRIYPHYVAQCQEIVSGIQIQLSNVGFKFQQQIHAYMAQPLPFEKNVQLQDRLQKAISYYLKNTAEIMGEFIESGLPDIENKAIRDQFEREFGLIKDDYQLKMQIFIRCSRKFDMRAYWDAKAQSAMQSAENTPSAKAGNKKQKKEKVEKISVTYDDDILHKDFYDQLRNWRNDKAADLGCSPTTIMHLKAMIGIANTLPMSSNEFLAIPGFGKKMLAAFGEELLHLVEHYKIKHNLE